MKKGFTLIELLAVIVILAIIALIATPTILNIIDSAGKSSAEASIESIDRAVELHYSKNQLNGIVQKETFICLNGECKNGIELLELDAKGLKVE